MIYQTPSNNDPVRTVKPGAVVDKLASLMFGQTRSQAHATNTCVRCKKSATDFTDQLSQKEYLLSAFCQECQDAFYD